MDEKRKRATWPWGVVVALSMISGCKPPPDMGKTVEVFKETAARGASNAKDAAETARDPEKWDRAVEQLQRDLKNPPRQFK